MPELQGSSLITPTAIWTTALLNAGVECVLSFGEGIRGLITTFKQTSVSRYLYILRRNHLFLAAQGGIDARRRPKFTIFVI